MRTNVFCRIAVLFLLLSPLNTMIAERYIGLNGPQTQRWSAVPPVSLGAENIVHWSGTSVTWRLNENGAGDGLTFAQTQAAVQNSFNSWQNLATSDISFSYANSTQNTWSNDGQNVLYWAEAGDPAHVTGQPLADPATKAATVLTFNSAEELLDADIVFDGRDWTWKVDGADVDVEGVAAHEIGHMFGLHHTEVTSTPRPTMYFDYQGIEWRSLEFDDQVGASYLYKGNLIDNETFSGTNYFYWGLSVASGKKLTINSSTTLNFGSGATLVVNGTLNATSATFTSTSPSTTWSGILFNSASSGGVSYCTISRVHSNDGSKAGITINNALPTIQNSTIEYITGTAKGIRVLEFGAPLIYRNTIRNTEWQGIDIRKASPTLRFNNITGSANNFFGAAAIFCVDYASPVLGSTSPAGEGRNTLTGFPIGLEARGFSTVYAGPSDVAYNNRFYGNSSANAWAY